MKCMTCFTDDENEGLSVTNTYWLSTRKAVGWDLLKAQQMLPFEGTEWLTIAWKEVRLDLQEGSVLGLINSAVVLILWEQWECNQYVSPIKLNPRPFKWKPRLKLSPADPDLHFLPHSDKSPNALMALLLRAAWTSLIPGLNNECWWYWEGRMHALGAPPPCVWWETHTLCHIGVCDNIAKEKTMITPRSTFKWHWPQSRDEGLAEKAPRKCLLWKEFPNRGFNGP